MANVSGDAGWSWSNMQQYIARVRKYLRWTSGKRYETDLKLAREIHPSHQRPKCVR